MKWYSFGEIRETPAIGINEINEVLSEAKRLRHTLDNVSVYHIINVLDSAGELFRNKESEQYRKVIEVMPSLLGWSKEMVAEGMEIIGQILSFEGLIDRLNSDIEKIEYLEQPTYHSRFRGLIKAVPRGIVAHVSAGNVFVGAVDTLVQGIITKNINILKMSSADPVFPMIFAETIKAIDPDGRVASSFALVPFKGGDKEVEAPLKAEADLLIVYGGEETVKAYREGAGFHTKIVEYGPKYSFMAFSSEEMRKSDLKDLAHKAARDFSMWEQSACSSPHCVYIDSTEMAEQFAGLLVVELNHWATEIPHAQIPYQEAVEILKNRELARVDEALGEAQLFIPGVENQDWTVVLCRTPKFRVSCHHRTVYVIICDSLFGEMFTAVRPYGEYIQSVAIHAAPDIQLRLGEKLCSMGADRITEVGMMTRRKHGTPHDGTRGVAEFLRWVSIGTDTAFNSSFDYADDTIRRQQILDRLNFFLRIVRKQSPFYADRLPATPLTSLNELGQLPILSQDEFRKHLPPGGEGILTKPLGHSVSFGSGGTTGSPKFVHRTVAENYDNARLIGKGYALSIFTPSDVVANLLYAGNMWASFTSHQTALEATGCHILPIAGNIAMENIVSFLRAFKANGVVSIPSVILSLAEYVEQNNYTDIRIDKIVSGGEHLFPEAKAYISKVLGTTKFASTGYLSNDTGCIGFQCECCEGPVHHIHEDYCIMEVVDPETEQVLPDGEAGKILVTNFSRFLMPLIRYDIGDMGRILTHRCQCGRQIKLMELLGRSDDTLIIGGGNISLSFIATVIKEFPELSFHFRMSASVKELKDLLTVEAETISLLTESRKRELEKELYDELLLQKPVLAAILGTSSIHPPCVVVCDPNTLDRNPRTGKIKQVIDNRKL